MSNFNVPFNALTSNEEKKHLKNQSCMRWAVPWLDQLCPELDYSARWIGRIRLIDFISLKFDLKSLRIRANFTIFWNKRSPTLADMMMTIRCVVVPLILYQIRYWAKVIKSDQIRRQKQRNSRKKHYQIYSSYKKTTCISRKWYLVKFSNSIGRELSSSSWK